MKIRAIIPAAGLGTRMGMKHNESKEMLYVGSKRLIDFSLDLCKKHNLDPLVITREDKTDLIEYLKSQNVETLIIEPEGEWANTVLKSHKLWYASNILILPDTEFEPTEIIDQIKNNLLLGCTYSIALHYVTDAKNWGIVKDYRILEKPSNIEQGYAWGLIGFEKEAGFELFYCLEKSKRFTLKNAGFSYLTEFKDRTRTGKL